MNESMLEEKLKDRDATVGVVGLGYVGLPLCVAFADAGFDVIGFDVSQRTIDSLQSGRSHIKDVSSDTVKSMVEAGNFLATADMTRLGKADALCICVPTPLNHTNDPDMSFVVSASESISEQLRPGQLVVLESTTFPGTTRDIVLPILQKSGLTVGEDFFLAFSPERVDPGNTKYGIYNTPKVIGGIDGASTRVATELYATAVKECVPVGSPEVAEMSKLLENTFRAVNIGLANEMALMCDKLGIDVWEVIRAAATKPFGFTPFFPGPGVGGHCIPLDPLYLTWKMQTLDYRSHFIESAMEINDYMPQHVISKVADSLNDLRKSVNGARVLIMGVAYKPNINDVRESPALDIIEGLMKRGANVTYHDPFVNQVTIGADTLYSIDMSAKLLAEVDCVVIVTNHRGFKLDVVLEHAVSVVDTRDATRGMRGKAHVVSL